MQEASFELPVVYTAHRCARPAERSAPHSQPTPLSLLLGTQLPSCFPVTEPPFLCTSHPGFWADLPISLHHLHFRRTWQHVRSLTDLSTSQPEEIPPWHCETPAASLLGIFPSWCLLNQGQQEQPWMLHPLLSRSASSQSVTSPTHSRGFKALLLSRVASRTAPGTHEWVSALPFSTLSREG